jgi:hypothetical protein
VRSSVTLTLGTNVENLTLPGAAAIDGTDNNLVNIMVVKNGDNTLVGLDGNDNLAASAAMISSPATQVAIASMAVWAQTPSCSTPPSSSLTPTSSPFHSGRRPDLARHRHLFRARRAWRARRGRLAHRHHRLRHRRRSRPHHLQ